MCVRRLCLHTGWHTLPKLHRAPPPPVKRLPPPTRSRMLMRTHPHPVASRRISGKQKSTWWNPNLYFPEEARKKSK